MLVYDEEARLQALYQLGLLDTPPSECFDRITRMASAYFRLPIAAISLTDRNRQWFKSRVGITHDSISRERAPCALVAESNEILVIPDVQADPCYRASDIGRQGVRFYAGAPLVTREGHGLGALCVLGPEPRTIDEAELDVLRDLAAMVMAQIELNHAFGRIDAVSGLPNRVRFIEDLEDLAREYTGQRRIAVLVDLARHDQINKIVRVMGAARVDEMVKETARGLRQILPPERIAYHVAATQFAFLSPPDVDPIAYMATIKARFAKARSTSTVRFVTTVAVGIMPFVMGDISAADVLRAAHSAAQDARCSDGAIGLYSSASDGSHRRQFELLHAFGGALEDCGQLGLAFQPRVDLASGRCVGAEALLRWRHPQLGDVSPAEFIPLVEQMSLARPMTEWVIRTALDQLALWRHAGLDVPLSINISAVNLEEDDFLARLDHQLGRSGVPTDMLELELTETSVMETSGRTLQQLSSLSDCGVRLAIDDFGTGYSSLAYLQRLPIHVVKIDQSFVRDMQRSGDRAGLLVSMMIELSHKLGYRVVAEGVETAHVAALLRAMGCEEAQGYHFGRPMTAADFTRWLSSDRSRPAERSAA